MEGGSFIRVRVRVDVNLPLCQGCIFSIEDSREVGSPSSTNTFLISATGVDDLIMLIEIAIFGLKVMVRWNLSIRNVLSRRQISRRI